MGGKPGLKSAVGNLTPSRFCPLKGECTARRFCQAGRSLGLNGALIWREEVGLGWKREPNVKKEARCRLWDFREKGERRGWACGHPNG